MRVAIVGAGIAGLATAWSLAKRGEDVTLFEQGSIPNPRSASGDEHRLMRRAYGDADRYSGLVTEAIDAWDELWTDLGQSHYADRGVLAINQFPNDGGSAFCASLDRGGYHYETYSPKEAAERHPFLDPGTFRHAYYSPEGGALLCQRIGAGIAGLLQCNGATLRPHTRIQAVDAARGVVTLDGGEQLEFDRVVVTAGAWTLKLFPDLAQSLTLCRTAVVYVEPPSHLRDAWLAAPAIQNTGGIIAGYVLPPADGTGLKFAAGVNKRLAFDPDANRDPAPGEGERLRDLFSAPFGNVQDYAVQKVVTCAYAFTEDHRFFCAPMGRTVVVSACSGHGYKFGAAVGRRIADGVVSGDVALLTRWLRAEEPASRAAAA